MQGVFLSCCGDLFIVRVIVCRDDGSGEGLEDAGCGDGMRGDSRDGRMVEEEK